MQFIRVIINPLTSLQLRYFNTTRSSNLIQKWRQSKGLPLNPNTCGVLTDKPDYTFLDGRPTPLGVRQKNRLIKQQKLAGKIIQFSKEIDFAVERHKQLQTEQQQQREQHINNKFKSKGKIVL